MRNLNVFAAVFLLAFVADADACHRGRASRASCHCGAACNCVNCVCDPQAAQPARPIDQCGYRPAGRIAKPVGDMPPLNTPTKNTAPDDPVVRIKAILPKAAVYANEDPSQIRVDLQVGIELKASELPADDTDLAVWLMAKIMLAAGSEQSKAPPVPTSTKTAPIDPPPKTLQLIGYQRQCNGRHCTSVPIYGYR